MSGKDCKLIEGVIWGVDGGGEDVGGWGSGRTYNSLGAVYMSKSDKFIGLNEFN